MTRTLIFAPHPDDELIGCGGLLLKAKDQVQVVYVTKGIKKGQPEEIAARRKKGVLEALKHLNVDQVFLDFYELMDKEAVKSASDKICEIISRFNPDTIYVPAFEGGNFDHDITNYIVSQSGKNVYEYRMYNNHVSVGKLFEILVRKILVLFGLKSHLWDNESFIPVRGFKPFFLEMTKKELEQKNGLIKKYEEISNTKVDNARAWPYNKDLFRKLPNHDYTKKPHAGLLPLGYTRTYGISFNQFLEVIE